MSAFLADFQERQASVKPLPSLGLGLSLSSDQLKDMLAQIEEQMGKDSRNVIKLLKLIKISSVTLEALEFTSAEKYFRTLI
jgi:hypothetical protein